MRKPGTKVAVQPRPRHRAEDYHGDGEDAGAEEGDDRIRAAYGGNYARLAEIKAKWDPDNVFRTNKNISPAGSGAAAV